MRTLCKSQIVARLFHEPVPLTLLLFLLVHADVAALLALKARGHNISLTEWVGNKACDWSGVKCLYGRVKEVFVSNKGLNGTIPKELGDLSELEGVYLGSNAFFG